MGLINGKPFQQDYKELMDRYDLYNISDQKTLEKIISLLNDFNGIGLGQVKSDDHCLKTLVEQNWMIIKLLDDIKKKLDK